MFRTKRTCCVALALLGVLLLPLPAMAGGFGEPASTALSWDGVWADLMAWLGLPSTESCAMVDPNGCPNQRMSSAMVDPLGGPNLNVPNWETAEDSSSIESCAMVDPDGCPGSH